MGYKPATADGVKKWIVSSLKAHGLDDKTIQDQLPALMNKGFHDLRKMGKLKGMPLPEMKKWEPYMGLKTEKSDTSTLGPRLTAAAGRVGAGAIGDAIGQGIGTLGLGAIGAVQPELIPGLVAAAPWVESTLGGLGAAGADILARKPLGYDEKVGSGDLATAFFPPALKGAGKLIKRAAPAIGEAVREVGSKLEPVGELLGAMRQPEGRVEAIAKTFRNGAKPKSVPLAEHVKKMREAGMTDEQIKATIARAHKRPVNVPKGLGLPAAPSHVALPETKIPLQLPAAGESSEVFPTRQEAFRRMLTAGTTSSEGTIEVPGFSPLQLPAAGESTKVPTRLDFFRRLLAPGTIHGEGTIEMGGNGPLQLPERTQVNVPDGGFQPAARRIDGLTEPFAGHRDMTASPLERLLQTGLEQPNPPLALPGHNPLLLPESTPVRVPPEGFRRIRTGPGGMEGKQAADPFRSSPATDRLAKFTEDFNPRAAQGETMWVGKEMPVQKAQALAKKIEQMYPGFKTKVEMDRFDRMGSGGYTIKVTSGEAPAMKTAANATVPRSPRTGKRPGPATNAEKSANDEEAHLKGIANKLDKAFESAVEAGDEPAMRRLHSAMETVGRALNGERVDLNAVLREAGL